MKDIEKAPTAKEEEKDSSVETNVKILKIIEDGVAPTSTKAVEPLKKLFKQVSGKEYSINDLEHYIEEANQLGLAISTLELNIKRAENLKFLTNAKLSTSGHKEPEPVNWETISEVLENSVEKASKKN